MGRNLNSRTKRMRRIGEKLLTHGEKAFSRRPYPPGVHGPKGTGRLSEYGVRLREKQKVQLLYGIPERQFRRYVNQAKQKKGNTGELLLQQLELRLDNIVFRAGFAPSRESARQLVRHGHVMVNNRRVNIPSYGGRIGDTVTILEQTKQRAAGQSIIKQLENYEAPAWLLLDKTRLAANVAAAPPAAEAAPNVNPQLIVEFYSR